MKTKLDLVLFLGIPTRPPRLESIYMEHMITSRLILFLSQVLPFDFRHAFKLWIISRQAHVRASLSMWRGGGEGEVIAATGCRWRFPTLRRNTPAENLRDNHRWCDLPVHRCAEVGPFCRWSCLANWVWDRYPLEKPFSSIWHAGVEVNHIYCPIIFASGR